MCFLGRCKVTLRKGVCLMVVVGDDGCLEEGVVSYISLGEV
jgi:hypothetical protein